MTKFKHFETESGKTIRTAQFDGYQIADRLLEGLMFQITIQDDGTLKASVKKEDEGYFSQFNTSKFLKEAEDFAYDYDIFEDPNSGEECWLVVDGVDNRPSVVNPPQPIVVAKANPFSTIFGGQNPTPQLNQVSQDEEVEEKKEPVIGKFKPKRKFLNFVSGVSNARVRLISDVAFIKGEKLSGLGLEDVIFKITICDEGTINFEEVDTNVTDDKYKQRLIDDICEMDVTGYTQKFVVSELEFQLPDTDGNKGGRCYLEVEHVKPIDKLKSLFDEMDSKKEISDKGLSFLDELLGDSTDTAVEEVKEEEKVEVVEEVKEKNHALSMMEESFRKMNEEKINELKSRIEDKERDIKKYKTDINHAEAKLKESSEQLRVLNTRLETMAPADAPTGVVFFVTEEQKNETGLDETTRGIADKIADLMGLKKDVLFDYLTGGFYKIKLANKTDFNDKNITKEIYEKVLSIDPLGKFTLSGDGEIEYRGELNWHQLTSSMIKKGFEQEPEFNKLAGSNSYESKEEVKEEEKCSHENCGCSDEETSGSTEPNTKLLTDISETTDIVIIGSHVDSVPTLANFSITDDFSSFDLHIGGKKFEYNVNIHGNKHKFTSVESDGFVNVLKVQDFIKMMKTFESQGQNMEDVFSAVGAVYLPNFKGEIRLAAMDNGKYYDFDPAEEYIQHQIGDKYDDVYADIIISLPDGTNASIITEPKDFVSLVRDGKLNTLLS